MKIEIKYELDSTRLSEEEIAKILMDCFKALAEENTTFEIGLKG